jgi:hypothetical protein
MARFCFITHQKGRMLRALRAPAQSWRSAQMQGHGITGGTSTEQMSRMKKREAKEPCSLGNVERCYRARPDEAWTVLLCANTGPFGLLTIKQAQSATTCGKPLLPSGLLPFDALPFLTSPFLPMLQPECGRSPGSSPAPPVIRPPGTAADSSRLHGRHHPHPQNCMLILQSPTEVI